MPLYQTAPSLLSPAVGMLAFRHVPLDQRTRTDWVRLVLDGLAVAVSGAVFFGYVLLNASPAGTPAGARAAAVAVGVGCLLALVVFGRAAISPQNRVDTGALLLLSAAPVVGLLVVPLFLGGTALGMLLLSVLGYPITAPAGTADAARRVQLAVGEPVQSGGQQLMLHASVGIEANANRGRHAIAAAVAQLADNLGLKAVAEGIETQDQLDRLRDMGFRYGQGFLMARPLPPAECGALTTHPMRIASPVA